MWQVLNSETLISKASRLEASLSNPVAAGSFLCRVVSIRQGMEASDLPPGVGRPPFPSLHNTQWSSSVCTEDMPLLCPLQRSGMVTLPIYAPCIRYRDESTFRPPPRIFAGLPSERARS